MQVINKIQLDISHCGVIPRIHAVQNDANTRIVEASLFAGGTPWEVPDGVTAAVAFRKPDGTRGLYDLLPDGTSAISVAGSTISFVLAPEVLTYPGLVKMSVILNDAQLDQLSTFYIDVQVYENPAAGEVVSNSYYNYKTLGDINTALNSIMQTLEKAVLSGDDGNVDMQGKAISKVGGFSVVNPASDEGDGMFTEGVSFDASGSDNAMVLGMRGVFGDESVILRGLAPGTQSDDAVIKKQLEDATGEVLKYSAQELTDEQKAQVRANIGAAAEGDASAGSDYVSFWLATPLVKKQMFTVPAGTTWRQLIENEVFLQICDVCGCNYQALVINDNGQSIGAIEALCPDCEGVKINNAIVFDNSWDMTTYHVKPDDPVLPVFYHGDLYTGENTEDNSTGSGYVTFWIKLVDEITRVYTVTAGTTWRDVIENFEFGRGYCADCDNDYVWLCIRNAPEENSVCINPYDVFHACDGLFTEDGCVSTLDLFALNDQVPVHADDKIVSAVYGIGGAFE